MPMHTSWQSPHNNKSNMPSPPRYMKGDEGERSVWGLDAGAIKSTRPTKKLVDYSTILYMAALIC